jgi:hypothetical protein
MVKHTIIWTDLRSEQKRKVYEGSPGGDGDGDGNFVGDGVGVGDLGGTGLRAIMSWQLINASITSHIVRLLAAKRMMNSMSSPY